ncbi:hypothetical protein HOY80DRAFT_630462 [Tuber brumale]|nr:hypothetical protein HOY80DRAFT_630462 [Tuber brumale]
MIEASTGNKCSLLVDTHAFFAIICESLFSGMILYGTSREWCFCFFHCFWVSVFLPACSLAAGLTCLDLHARNLFFLKKISLPIVLFMDAHTSESFHFAEL